MKIIKRDGRIEQATSTKICNAIRKSTNGDPGYDEYKLTCLAIDCLDKITEKYKEEDAIDVDIIHNEVIYFLKEKGLNVLANNYSEYREMRNKQRFRRTELAKTLKSIGIKTDRDNGNRL